MLKYVKFAQHMNIEINEYWKFIISINTSILKLLLKCIYHKVQNMDSLCNAILILIPFNPFYLAF